MYFCAKLFFMAYHEPLDHFSHSVNALTAQEIIRRLQKHGFNEVYEVADGSVEIKGQASLKCQIKKFANDSWAPEVGIERFSVYALIPAVILGVLAQVAGFSGTFPTVVSASLGVGIGSLILDARKKATVQRLEIAVFEME